MTPKGIEDIYKLSPLQQGILFHTLAGASGAYFDQIILSRSRTETALLRRCWRKLHERHTVLRTTFLWEDLKEPVQVVHERPELPFHVVDVSRLDLETAEAERQRWARLERRTGFDLVRGPLWRVVSFDHGGELGVVWSYHHLLLDGWSVERVQRELGMLYYAAKEGRELELAPVRPFRDYIRWLARRDPAVSESFWRETLHGFGAPTPLGIDRPRGETAPGVRGYGENRQIVDRRLLDDLRQLSRRLRVTLNTVLEGVWALTLGRWAGRRDVVFGVTFSGRPASIKGVQEMVGCFINTLPVRLGLDPAEPIEGWLQRIQAQHVELLKHEHDPLLQIQRWSEVPGDQPLFETLLVSENVGIEQTWETFEQTHYPITVMTINGPQGLEIVIHNDRGRVSDSAGARLLRHLVGRLERIVRAPGARLAALWGLERVERHQLLVEWNDSGAELAPAASALELFVKTARKVPDAIAASHGDAYLSYAELGRRSARQAARLRELGVETEHPFSEDIVALWGSRGLEFLTAILAIWRAGGAYLPLDPHHPPERLRQVLAQSGARLALVGDGMGENLAEAARELPETDRPRLEFLADFESEVPLESAKRGPSRLAYVIFTSGSTGQPKGAMVEERGMVNHLWAKIFDLEIGPGDTLAQTATQSFDISVWQFIAALVVGGRTAIFGDEIAHDPARLLASLERERITLAETVPSLMRFVLDEVEVRGEARPELGALRWLVPTGEALPPELARRWLAAYPRVPLVNAYGPTECSDDVSHHTLRSVDEGLTQVPIGKPVANTRLVVADRRLEPTPLGVPGELVVAGLGVGRGYLDEGRRTAQVFVPDPWAESGGRLYRTGDLVRRLDDGALDFLGRIDHQVKIRGFRIELGEIENALGEHAQVGQAVVLAREDRPGDRRLVAYTVASENAEATPEELRHHLEGRLPEYMVPAAFVLLPEFPLNPSGKVDRKRLPEPTAEGAELGAEPRTPTEELVAGIWAEVLELPQVGRDDNFFDLGGHSLLITRVASRVRQVLGVELALGRLFERPTVAALAAEIDVETARGRSAEAPPLVRLERPEGEAIALPLSYAQERLWFLDQLLPDRSTYNIPQTVELEGELSVPALDAALGEIVRRHEVLRTRFEERGGEPVQVVERSAETILPVIDLEALDPAVRAAESRRLGRVSALETFDLGRGPLLRARLVRLDERRHAVLFAMHHIVSDGWSMQVFQRELALLYRAATHDGISPLPELAALPELTVQYADFAAWQRQWLGSGELDRQLEVWRERLEGAPETLELPTDRPPRALADARASSVQSWLSPELAAEIEALGRRFGATLFMVLLGTFQTFLLRLTGQRDVVVGSPIAGRNRRETEELIGFFVNTLVLRGDLGGDPEVKELLERTREVTLEAYGHQDVPFERLVEELAPERRLDQTPLFRVFLTLQNAPPALPAVTSPAAGELRMRTIMEKLGSAKFDLNLTVSETPQGFHLMWGFRRALFDDTTVRRWARAFEGLLGAAVEKPKARLAELPMMGMGERHQLIVEWNEARPDYRVEALLPEILARRAAERRDAVALIAADGAALTWGELERRSAGLAAELRRRGAGPETPVGVCLERSPEAAVALLAVLRSGAAYLPLDPSYPEERLAYMVADARPLVILGQGEAGRHLAEVAENAPDFLDAAEDFAGSAPLPELDPEHPAYAIYTSGSTGQPKGVVVSHGALANRLLYDALTGLDPETRLLQFAPISFDMSAFQLFAPLAAGGTVVLARAEDAADPDELVRLAAAQRLTELSLPPAVIELLLDTGGLAACPALRRVMSGGEALGSSLPARLADELPGVDLVNRYGPTEATVAITSWTFPRPSEPGPPPIGRPIARSAVHLLDRELAPVPLGAVGELAIGGPALARGYLERPALSAELFVPDPLAGLTAPVGSRLYKTGDLARRRADGAVLFAGRADHQVKIRGFRVELGEIEAALRCYPPVREAAVIDIADGAALRLLAYAVPEAEAVLTEAELRKALAEQLPEVMVPSAFVILEELPRTAVGKLDRDALPAPAVLGGGEIEVPRTPAEEMVVAIFEEVLGLEALGRAGDFFELGGHSLLATQAVSRLRSAFGVELPLRVLFEAPTVAGLAERLETAQRSAHSSSYSLELPRIEPVPRGGHLRLSFAQERLWYIDRLEPANPVYNIPLATRLAGELDLGALAGALGGVVRRHETLRTRFAADEDGRAFALIDDDASVGLPLVDLSGVDEYFRSGVARRLARAEALRPFDLERGPLVRARLLRLGERDHVLLLNVHHIVSDGWSMRVIVRELAALYGAALEDSPETTRPSPLPELSIPELSIQYADYAAWQRGWLEGEMLDVQLGWWRELLAGAPSVLELPTDRPHPPAQNVRGSSLFSHLPGALAEGLQSLGRRSGATLFMTLLAGFETTLARWSGQRDLNVGTPIANRHHLATEPLVGFFVNTLVLRGDLTSDPSFRELLAQTREVTLGAHAHQDLPFEKLVAELAPERSLVHTPLFQVMLVLQNASNEALELPGLELEIVPLEAGTAKFDLTLTAVESPEGLGLELAYRAAIFDASTARRLLRRLRTLLEGAIADPEARLSELPLLAPAERHQLLLEWNAGARRRPESTTVERLFEARVEELPDGVAVAGEGWALSYRELERRSNLLARYLRTHGVGTDSAVGVALERSPELAVALLAVLKAGGGYVPFDASYPEERLAFMAEDAEVPVLITRGELAGRLPRGEAKEVCLDRDGAEIYRGPAARPPGGGGPESLIYAIYTSGSTGKPKGATVTHRAVVNRMFWLQETFRLEPGERVLHKTPISFDVSVWEIFWPLTAGGTAVMARPGGQREPAYLARFAARERISTLHFVPSLLRVFVEEPAAREIRGLRRVIASGEALTIDLEERFFELFDDIDLVNMYGPSEAARATWWPCERPPRYRVAPLGRPIPNLKGYVVDLRLEPSPVGAPGELALGGIGVGRGYLRRPALSAEKFIPDPFAGAWGARLYRTGDRVRLLSDGNLEFLGRLDHQVKVRGLRVELGEIEAALLADDAVREAVVVARDEAPGVRRLVAYVSFAEGGAETRELRQRLSDHLPDYMVPAVFVVFDELPLLPSGKIDRAGLARRELEERELPAAAYEAPRGEAERALAEVWAQVLGLERVGVRENFFELGGDSILSLQVIARARRAGLELGPQQIFQYPTVAELAAVAAESSRHVTAEQGPVVGDVPLTPIQRSFWEDPPAERHHWNQALLLAAPRIARPVLAGALARLLEHHDALRLRYALTQEGVRQRNVAPGGEVPLVEIDLSALESAARPAALDAAAEQVQASLDLERGPIVRAACFELGHGDLGDEPEPLRLLLAIHHLAVDGVSWRILVEDLERLCAGGGEPVELDAKTTSFKTWAERLEEEARSEATLGELELWRELAGGAPANLPRDAEGPDPVSAVGVVESALDAEATEALLRRVPAVYRTRIDEVLLTALARAAARITGDRRLAVELEGHGREPIFDDVDLSRTVGWCTASYPLRLELPAEGGPGAGLAAVKERLRSIPRRGLGWGLLRHLGPAEVRGELARFPRPEIGFNYLGQIGAQRDGGREEGAEPRGLFRLASEAHGRERSARGERRRPLDVTASVAAGRLHLRFFHGRCHRRETVEAFARAYETELRALIAHGLESEGLESWAAATPSDFPLAGLDAPGLRRALAGAGEVEDLYPLSPLQEGLLVHALAGGELYFEQTAVRFDRQISPPLLRAAWQRAVDRHPALRTAFVWRDLERPLQRVHGRAEVPAVVVDLSRLEAADAELQVEVFLATERRRGFDFERPPLLRLGFLRLAGEAWWCALSHHHVLLDGWSTSRLFAEVFAHRHALESGGTADLPAPRPYRDYVAWLQAQDPAEAERFWRRQLAGFERPTPLFGSRRAGRELMTAGSDRGTARRRLSAARTAELESVARRFGVTLNTLVQAAWARVLGSAAGETDVVFGATVSGRSAPIEGIGEMVGLFINTLPVRSRFAPERRLGPWLGALQESQAEAGRFEHTPLTHVQGWSDVPAGQPLFESILVFENYPVDASVAEAGGGLEIGAVRGFERTHYPLTLVAVPQNTSRGGLSFALGFDRRRIGGVHALRALDRLEALLSSIAENPEAKAGELAVMSPGERHQLLVEWNEPRPDYASSVCLVHELFERRTIEIPEAVAVISDAGVLSFGELERRSRRLAHELRRRGAGREIVAVCLERSLKLVISVVAVLRAGSAYLPLDPTYPAERLAFMVEDAGVEVVVSQSELDALVSAPGVEKLFVDRFDFEGGEDPALEPVTAGLERAAYVIYTSGSTGRPKGVVNSHRAVVNRLDFDALADTRDSRYLQIAAVGFDMSVPQIFTPLSVGFPTVLVESGREGDPDYLHALVARERVLQMGCAPLVLSTVLEQEGISRDWAHLRLAMSGGDAVTPDLPEKFYERLPNARLENRYGPTEATVGVVFWSFPPGRREEPVPIGRPVSKARVHLLDGRGEIVPLGAVGEIHLGGVCLARGYLGRPGRTAESFVPDPFVGEGPGSRLYKTGDLARFRNDGAILFAGRADHQVKIRGFRVELGEIERVLRRSEAVREAAVDAIGEGLGRRLVAWVVPAREAAPAELAAFLARKLPDYMVPSAFVELDELPVGPSGKVDRERLPRPELPELEAGEAPRGPAEEIVAGIWAEVLELERIGRHDDFFELGGHSLLATRVVSRLRRAFGVELELRRLFEAPTVAELAAELAQIESGLIEGGPAAPEIVPRPRSGLAPLSFAQERLVFLDRLEPGSAAYVIASALRLKGPLDAPALEATLGEIVRRHEVLRTTFTEAGGRLGARVHTRAFELATVEIPRLEEGEVRRLAREEAGRPFDLEAGPLLRATRLVLGPEESVLLVAIHHAIFDGASMGIFRRELAALYAAFSQGRPSPLGELGVQYADYAVWQRRYLEGGELDRQLEFWRRSLEGVPQTLELPTDRPRPPQPSYRGGSVDTLLDPGLSARLESFARGSGATPFMVLLGLFQVFLARVTGQRRMVVGTPIAGRHRAELEDLIGLFVNTLALGGDLSSEPSFEELVRQVRETTLGAFAHQDLPFEKLVEELDPERDLSRPPIFQALFELQTAAGRGPGLNGSGLRVETLGFERPTAQFELTLNAVVAEGRIALSATYARDLFDRTTVRRWLRAFETLAAAAAADPERPFDQLEIAAPAERHQVLAEWNDTGAALGSGATIHGLVWHRAARVPDAVALSFEGAQLSYGELEGRARALAARLREEGAGLENRVGVAAERSLELVVGLLAVVETGAAYVPLDPGYPRPRLETMLEDAAPAVILADAAGRRSLGGVAVPIVELTTTTPAAEAPSPELPGALAYTIFTSGSTGRPKGAMNPHAGVVNRLLWMQEYFGLGAGDTVLQKTPMSFDVSVWEFFWPLLAGARLAVARPEGHRDPAYLSAAIERERVTTLHFVPSMLRAFLEAPDLGELSSLARVVTSGEALPRELAERFFAGGGRSRAELHNLYGPTEAAVDVTAWHLESGMAGPVPIGRPVAATRILVVDGSFRPVPIGVTGELLIGGTQVGRGYLGRPALSAERFVPDPVAVEPGARIYRTGDLARHRADGGVEFLGRLDHQVKIRGVRIELGEVEAALSAEEGVAAAAVVVPGGGAGGERLVAFVVPEGEFDTRALGETLRRRLPEAMVPSLFFELDALPQLPNGKVDRGRLARRAAEAQDAAVPEIGAGARDGLELELENAFARALGQPVGIRDDFFASGGHSLLALRLVAELRDRGLEVPVAEIFRSPTVERLAAALRDGVELEVGLAVALQPRGERPPLFVVHPLSGDVFCYRALSRELGEEQPFYGLQSPAHTGGEALGNVGAMAERYLEELAARHDSGPVLLAGWSLGGLVAYEMARRLHAAGREPALVALFDTWVRDPSAESAKAEDWRRLLDLVAHVSPRAAAEIGARVAELPSGERFAAIVEELRSSGQVPGNYSSGSARRQLEVGDAHRQAAREYRPGTYPGRVTLFLASQRPRGTAMEKSAPEDPTLGWGKLAPVEVVRVPGSHQEMIFPPAVSELARELRRALDGALERELLVRR